MMFYRKIVAPVLFVAILIGLVAAGPQSPTVFRKVDYYVLEDGEMEDYDAQLIIAPRSRSIIFADEDNATSLFAVVDWDRITTIVYENTKHASSAGFLVKWPLMFLTGRKHWLTITFGPGQNNSPGGYVYVRMDKDNFQNILAAINGFTGKRISRIEEDGETSTYIPGAFTEVQPVEPLPPEQVPPVEPTPPRQVPPVAPTPPRQVPPVAPTPPKQKQVQPVAPTQPRKPQIVAPTQPKPDVDNPPSTAPPRPEDSISAGALPPMPPTRTAPETWLPPEKLASSVSWTTRDADGVGYQWSVAVNNGNNAPMRTIATIVLRDATGGALYTTHVSNVVPPNTTHQLMGTGTVPNEAAVDADHWTIDIARDPESLSVLPATPRLPPLVPAETPASPTPRLLPRVDYPVLPVETPGLDDSISFLEGIWRSGPKTMKITRVPEDKDLINYTPDSRYFYAVVSGGGGHFENYRFADPSSAGSIGATFPGGILMLWNCQEKTAVDGFFGQIRQDNAFVFQNGATLTILSRDEIRVQSTIPMFILTSGYSRIEDPRPPGGCLFGSPVPAAETTLRTEVWQR